MGTLQYGNNNCTLCTSGEARNSTNTCKRNATHFNAGLFRLGIVVSSTSFPPVATLWCQVNSSPTYNHMIDLEAMYASRASLRKRVCVDDDGGIDKRAEFFMSVLMICQTPARIAS